ncbi:MAG: OsmC family protein [Candidatus Krumholzibacteriota bacterium]|nr:OsmC family protein [Candidatus Krumholzibacteriota bacterium]
MDLTVTFPGNQKVRAEYNGFIIKSDQPEEDGGEGSAPSPFDLFLASIATCSGTYLLRFCQSRDIATDDIKVIQKMESNGETGKLEKIRIIVDLPDDFPEKYKKAALNSMELCTVKKNIIDPPEFEFSVL